MMSILTWHLMTAVQTTDTSVVGVVLQRTALESLGDVALILLAAVALGLVAFMIPMVRSVAKMQQELNGTLAELRTRIGPTLDSAGEAASGLRDAVGLVRRQLEDVSDTIHMANTSARDAVRNARKRARRLAATVDLVQQEVEDVAVSATSLMRGLKVGAGEALSGRRRNGRRRDEAAHESIWDDEDLEDYPDDEDPELDEAIDDADYEASGEVEPDDEADEARESRRNRRRKHGGHPRTRHGSDHG